MKASLKFTEDQAPLLRAKLPLTVARFPLMYGIAMGNSQDLTLHLGTFFDAGPSCKIAYKPNGTASPFSFVLKTGFGLWGSPNGAALAMTAEFNLSGKGGPFFSVHFKPRIGDFGFKKHARSLSNSSLETPREFPGLKHGSIEEHGFTLQGTAPLKLERSLSSPPVPNVDGHVPLYKVGSLSNGNLDALFSDRLRSSASDSNTVIGSNFSFEVEELDKEKKGREWKEKMDGLRDLEAVGQSDIGIGGMIGDIHDHVLQEEGKGERSRLDFNGRGDQASAGWPFGFDGSFKGWSAIAHSSLPLGKHAKLKVRWGVKVPSDLFRNWGNRMSCLTVTKLPLLLMDKISVETVNPAANKELQGNLPLNELACPFEYDLLPFGISEDRRELAHVAAMCCSMKRQLRLLYTENKVLRMAMDDVRSEFQSREARKPGDICLQEEGFSRPQVLDDSSKRNGKVVDSQKNNGMKNNRRDIERKRDRRDSSKNDLACESNGVSADKTLSLGGSHSEVSEELRKAIFNASSSPTGERND